MEEQNKKYLSKQIITYMGNKRKLLGLIDSVINDIKKDLKKQSITSGDGFSGSGIVSRLLKLHSSTLYSNDIANYSKTLNLCFLSNVSDTFTQKLQHVIQLANEYVDNQKDESYTKFISKFWAPRLHNSILKNERAYFTKKNAERIDKYLFFIHNIDDEYKIYLLSSLLVECSIHNNTSGHFAAFYKKDGIGYFGGKNANDLKRITGDIRLHTPILFKNECTCLVDQKDANEWVKSLPELDVVYYDPPYNKHPYSIYYFLLDIINNYDTNLDIPETLRGQPKKWIKSDYNSIRNAEKAFTNLIMHTKAKYILVSYNNDGIISKEKMRSILEDKGEVSIIESDHKTYNRLKGMAKYKREKENKKIKEFLWVVKTY